MALGSLGLLLITKAQSKPQSIAATSIGSNTFTVSFFTASKSPAELVVADNPDFNNPIIFNDVRDFNEDGLATKPAPRNSHIIIARNLEPNKEYWYKVRTVYNDVHDKELFTVKTPNVSEEVQTPLPVYGQVVDKEGNPLENILVNLQVIQADGRVSSVITTYTAQNGSYSLDLANLRTADNSENWVPTKDIPFRYRVTAYNHKESYFHDVYGSDNLTPVKTFAFAGTDSDYVDYTPETSSTNSSLASQLISQAKANDISCVRYHDYVASCCDDKFTVGENDGYCTTEAQWNVCKAEADKKCNAESKSNTQKNDSGSKTTSKAKPPLEYSCNNNNYQNVAACCTQVTGNGDNGNCPSDKWGYCQDQVNQFLSKNCTNKPSQETNWCHVLHHTYNFYMYDNEATRGDACVSGNKAREAAGGKCVDNNYSKHQDVCGAQPGPSNPAPSSKPSVPSLPSQPAQEAADLVNGCRSVKVVENNKATFSCHVYVSSNGKKEVTSIIQNSLCNGSLNTVDQNGGTCTAYTPTDGEKQMQRPVSTAQPTPSGTQFNGSIIECSQINSNTNSSRDGYTACISQNYPGTRECTTSTKTQYCCPTGEYATRDGCFNPDTHNPDGTRKNISNPSVTPPSSNSLDTNVISGTVYVEGYIPRGAYVKISLTSANTNGYSTHSTIEPSLSGTKYIFKNLPLNETFIIKAYLFDSSDKQISEESPTKMFSAPHVNDTFIIKSTVDPYWDKSVDVNVVIEENQCNTLSNLGMLCTNGKRCSYGGSVPLSCVGDVKQDDGAACVTANDCKSNRCEHVQGLLATVKKCVSAKTTLRGNGQSCTFDSDCISNTCVLTGDGSKKQCEATRPVITEAQILISEDKCDEKTVDWLCTNSKRCTKGWFNYSCSADRAQENGKKCYSNSDCLSNFCEVNLKGEGKCTANSSPSVLNSLSQRIDNAEAQSQTKALTVVSGRLVDPGVYQLPNGTTTILATPTKFNFYMDTNGNGVRDENEDIILDTEYTLIKQTESFNYDLLNGWNAINFPFYKSQSELFKASEIRAIAATQGINISSIKKWEGKWVEYTVSNSNGAIYGQDFTIKPNEGYFIRATSRGTLSLYGVTPTKSVPMQLLNGWSLVGVAPGYAENMEKSYSQSDFKDGIQAFEFLKVLNNTDSEIKADNVTKYDSGVYRGVTISDGTDGKKIQFGIDYSINELEGYFVRSNKKTVFAP